MLIRKEESGAPLQTAASKELAQVTAAGLRLDGRVPPVFGAASGGPCASKELAQVMAAGLRLDGRVPPVFGAASGGPCASKELAQVMAAGLRLDGRVPPVFGAASGGPCASKVCTTAMLFLVVSLAASVPARADTIGITYSVSGVGTVTGMSGVFLDLSGAATGSVDQWNPAVNAVWNPVTYDDVGQLNLSNGSFNGVFTMTFANGDMLSGTVFEDQTMVNPATTTGPFTQTLTFTAGTGEFAGVSGTGSGGGFVTPTGYTDAGSGTLTAPGLITPEPGSIALVLGGFLLIALRYRPRPNNRIEKQPPSNSWR